LHNIYCVRPNIRLNRNDHWISALAIIRSPDLILYDPRKVLALDAPGCVSPVKPHGASFGHRNDSFVCKAVTALERTGIVMLIVRLDNNGFNKAVVRHFVMLSVCNIWFCDNTHRILRDGINTKICSHWQNCLSPSVSVDCPMGKGKRRLFGKSPSRPDSPVKIQ
jgi:hypothetical protein